jgi:hypothetical protein
VLSLSPGWACIGESVKHFVCQHLCLSRPHFSSSSHRSLPPPTQRKTFTDGCRAMNRSCRPQRYRPGWIPSKTRASRRKVSSWQRLILLADDWNSEQKSYKSEAELSFVHLASLGNAVAAAAIAIATMTIQLPRFSRTNPADAACRQGGREGGGANSSSKASHLP